jgi:hypothetical protein
MRNYIISVGAIIGMFALSALEFVLLVQFGMFALIPIMVVVVFIFPAWIFWNEIKRDWQEWRL